MKVLLIYPNVAKTLQIPMGLAYISSYLKEKSIEVDLWDGTFDSEEDLINMVCGSKFDVICFSALSPDYNYVVDLAQNLYGYTDALFVIGGYHATFCAEEVYRSGLFDSVIIGEAEYALYEYLIGNNRDPFIKGQLTDVNDLPWPDHDMFKRHFVKQLGWESKEHNITGVFLTARGCPFKCTYCSCEALSNLYNKKITRFRNLNDLMHEIICTTEKFNMDNIWFTDETFTISKKRILKFCELYKKDMNIPFSIETRPDTVDEEVLTALKEAGCTTIRMGIESGVDRIRNDLYKRNMSRETIINAFHTAKSVGLKTSSFNICGAPTESIEDIRETIELNLECWVDSAKMTLLSVFPGTKMWDYCKENGYEIRKEYPENYYIDSNFKHDTLTIPQLIELRNEFNNKLN